MSRFIAIFSETPDALIESAHRLSPRVERYPPEGVILEVPGRYEPETLDRLKHVLDPGTRPRIGVASTRTAALLMARARPGTVIPPGKQRDALAPLPVRLLSLIVPFDGGLESTLQTLARWGIETLGELAVLPAAELAARLGETGLQLQQLAKGEDREPFQAVQPAPVFEESRELDWILDSLEPLAFILGVLLETLCTRLQKRGLSAESAEVRLRLADRSDCTRPLRLAFPMHQPKVLLSLLRLELQAHPPPSGITAVSVRLTPARSRIFQFSLLEPAAAHPEELARTLTRLQRLVGEENVGCPVLVDTHRPDAVRMEGWGERGNEQTNKRTNEQTSKRVNEQTSKRANEQTITGRFGVVLRRLRPPLPTRFPADRIVACSGPWRTSGDWWKGETETGGWSRDEWDVELSGGMLCRIYLDRRQNQWFLEGIYD